MIKYIIPDSGQISAVNDFLFDCMHTYPEWFYDDFKLDAAYGLIKNTIWTAGRAMYDKYIISLAQIEEVISGYQSEGMTYRFVFSNRFLEKEDLYDYWGNACLKIGEKYNSGVIVASDLLANYIHEKYPKIHLVSSVTKGVLNDEQRKTIFENPMYKLLVVNTHYNHNLEETVPVEYRKKAEILINDCCPPNCPFHQRCYDDNSMLAKGQERNGSRTCKNNNRPKNSYFHVENEWIKENCENLTVEEVRELHKKGFEYFKINGRSFDEVVNISAYADYLVKPEFRDKFICDAMFDLFVKKRVKQEWRS